MKNITIYDPIQIVLQATKEAGYNPKCHIQYSDEIRGRFNILKPIRLLLQNYDFRIIRIFGEWGLTFWPDDNSGVIVEISSHLKVMHIPEVLAHELAHVISGYDAGHGERWKDVFDKIHEKYCEIIERG